MKSRGNAAIQVQKNFLTKTATLLYALGVNTRLACYRSGRWKTQQLSTPVISVGNLTVGGTGKTPCTALIANFLSAEGLQVAILSRGYKRQSNGLVEVSNGQQILCDARQAGDEPYLLAQLCPGARVVVNVNRYEAGKWLEARAQIDVFILDDGYQHVQLARDLNILLLDGQEPLGNGVLLPLGTLRDPIIEMRRADVVLATRMNEATSRDALRALVHSYCRARTPLFFARHEIVAFKLLNAVKPLPSFQQQPLAAFSGIAKPERFFTDLKQQHLQLEYSQAFPDHHRYTAEDVSTFVQRARVQQAAAIITTEKDAANLPPDALAQIELPVYAAQLQFKIENEIAFKMLVRQTIKR